MIRPGLFALLLLSVACQPNPTPIHSPEDYPRMVGKEFPDFQLQDMQGNLVQWSDIKGKPALINFWFTRCPPCVAEIPHLNTIKKDFSREAVHFLAIAPDNPALIAPFLLKHPFDFTILPNAQPFIDLFGNEFPLNLFVDKKGIIRHARGAIPTSFSQQQPQGFMDDREFRRMLGNLIRE
jgi:peroxiredoxin